MYRLIAITFLFISFGNGHAQDMGVHFGHQMFGVFNANQPLQGVSIGLDIPRTGFITPYGQVSAFLPKKDFAGTIGQGIPKDPNDFFNINADANIKTSTFSFEVGTIYYIGGAYDYGFSGLFQNSFRILLMNQKVDLIDFDFDKYTFEPFQNAGGIGFVLNTSLGGGLKYTFEWGSLYALANLEFALYGDRLPSYYFDEFGSVSPFSFSTRIGIRRELDFSKSGERKQIRENNRKERQKW
jgi:hypothetical protein